MFKGILGGLLMATGALVLAAGVVGVIVVVERALSNRQKDQQPPPTPDIPAKPPVVAVAEPQPTKPKAERHFSIKRTKSEVGYVYWILEGHGKYKCFVLCDSWEEAMEQAKARLEGESEEMQEFAFART
jgi:hypothetical protein